MAAVVSIFQPHPRAAGLPYKNAASALAASAVIVLAQFTLFAPGIEPAQNPPQQSRLTGTLSRQLRTARATAAVLEGSTHNTCVMAIGKNGKLSVGFGDGSRETSVSLVAC